MKTPFKRLDRYAFNEHRFNTLEEAQEYIRKNNKSPDYISVAGILYTMEEYDEAGKNITYANLRNMLQIDLETQNRYKYGFSDAQLYLGGICAYRNDITFAD